MIQLEYKFFEELTSDKVIKLFDKIAPYIDKRVESYDRYRRKKFQTEFMKSLDKKVLVAFENYIVNMTKGYLSGKAPSFSFKNHANIPVESFSKYELEIKNILADNDNPTVFADLIHDFITTGAAYLYLTGDEKSDVKYHVSSSRSTFVIYDYMAQPNPIAMLRVFNRDNGKFLEVVTAKNKRRYNEKGVLEPFEDYDGYGNLVTLDEKPLFWEKVPVIPFEHPDGQAIFEPAIELIETYENLIANVRNMTQYNDSAKLVSYGNQSQNYTFIEDDEGNQVVNPLWLQEMRFMYEAPAFFCQTTCPSGRRAEILNG